MKKCENRPVSQVLKCASHLLKLAGGVFLGVSGVYMHSEMVMGHFRKTALAGVKIRPVVETFEIPLNQPSFEDF